MNPGEVWSNMKKKVKAAVAKARKPKARKPHIERYIGEDFNWRLRLVAANGEKILGPDPYDSESNAQRAAEIAAEQLGIEIKVLGRDPEPPTTRPIGEA